MAVIRRDCVCEVQVPRAGQYPIVRGPGTISRFVEELANVPKPNPPFVMRTWLQGQGLASSYFTDLLAFSQFIGLVGDDGPTDLWATLRDAEQRQAALLTALREAYDAPLKALGLEAPAAGDVGRLARYITTYENVSADQGTRAAETLVRAFDVALGRSVPTEGGSQKQNRTTVTPPPKSRSKGEGKNGRRGDVREESRDLPRVAASLAINIQIILPADAPDDRYDAMLAAVAKHMGQLLR